MEETYRVEWFEYDQTTWTMTSTDFDKVTNHARIVGNRKTTTLVIIYRGEKAIDIRTIR